MWSHCIWSISLKVINIKCCNRRWICKDRWLLLAVTTTEAFLFSTRNLRLLLWAEGEQTWIFLIIISLKVVTLFGEQRKIKYLPRSNELKSNHTSVRQVINDLVIEHTVSKKKVFGGYRQQVLFALSVNNKGNLNLTVNVIKHSHTHTHRFQKRGVA